METQSKRNGTGYLTPAVCVRNGFKKYGTEFPILNNFNMTVQQGTIYGLLGASGCGKTTILSCIVGLKKLDSGKVNVFGALPGSRESGIPGRTVGYMPQDIGLYQVFTIQEILHYFGKIYGMTRVEVESRIKFLVTFLDLPDCTKEISTLSGGQQRRTSLAAAMIHEPKIMILDEPTVGVDPLIRESIWNHLRDIVDQRGTTVIITTHYIEEARQSDMIGLMRNGRLLTEKPPLTLLREHNVPLLEDIVLKLCKKDSSFTIPSDSSREIEEAISNASFYPRKNVPLFELMNPVRGLTYKPRSPDDLTVREPRKSGRKNNSMFKHFGDDLVSHYNKIGALLTRNRLSLFRYPGFLGVLLLLPTLHLVLINIVLGREVQNLSVGVVNHEFQSTDFFEEMRNRNCTSCLDSKLSFNFLTSFPEDEIKWVPFHSEKEALEALTGGRSPGYISIPANFTSNFRDRALEGNFASNESIDGSDIGIVLDMTNPIQGSFLQDRLSQYYIEFLKDLVSSCGGDSRSAEMPFKFNSTYGSLKSTVLESILPSQILLIIFAMPIANAFLFIWDRKSGSLDRNLVAGVKLGHIFTAFFISESVVILTSISIFFGMMFFVFELSIKGSFWTAFALCYLQGIASLSFGFVLGVLCNHELDAAMLGLAHSLPLTNLTGGLWPLEGQPEWLRNICQLLPVTASTEALRSIFNRGWGLDHPHVWLGFVSVISWIILYCLLSGAIYRLRK